MPRTYLPRQAPYEAQAEAITAHKDYDAPITATTEPEFGQGNVDLGLTKARMSRRPWVEFFPGNMRNQHPGDRVPSC
jgi:hypothetical protein